MLYDSEIGQYCPKCGHNNKQEEELKPHAA
jgi:predicted nucleic-acid-binding Zn-ribbon protein